MSGNHHSLIHLSSSNLSAHYTLMYLCQLSTSSTQPHLLTDENRIIGSFTLCLVFLNLATVSCNTLIYIYILLVIILDVWLFCCVILSIIIFKEVNLVNRGVWVDKDLASQRSHKEAYRGSLLTKLLKEATWNCLGKNTAQPSLTVGSSRKLVWSFNEHFSMIWPLGCLRRCLECVRRFRFWGHYSLVRFEPCSPSSFGKMSFLLLLSSKTISNVPSSFSITYSHQ